MRQFSTVFTLTVFAIVDAPVMRMNASILENRHVRQCVVIITESWSSPNGTMTTFDRGMLTSDWQRRQSTVPVVVGRAGLAWGEGIAMRISSHGVRSKFFSTFLKDHEPFKAEGDDKSPAGIFFLGGIFGYARKAPTRMAYLTLSPNIVGVDDPKSRYYNQLIDKSKVKKHDWRTAEEMFRKDDLYKWGVLVDHNVRAKPGAGSCIFLHIWESPTTSTSGCTAMSEKNLVDLIHWLDPAFAPVLIQLPRPAYNELREEWRLPKL